MASKVGAGAASASFGVGDRVRVVTHGKAGTVRFVGETQFAAGVWVGVELDEPGACGEPPISLPSLRALPGILLGRGNARGLEYLASLADLKN